MVKGYIPENGRQNVQSAVIASKPTSNTRAPINSTFTTLSRPEIVLQAIVRPVRTGGCGGCGMRVS
jgi:hypothetical protein